MGVAEVGSVFSLHGHAPTERRSEITLHNVLMASNYSSHSK